jgi:hypothetical protein
VEYVATIVILLIFLGPIAWALIAGRRGGVPRQEDSMGGSAINEHIRRKNTDWRG